jgi:site-specific DNA-adenine methylase
MVYAFNNDIRFNAAGSFNLPVGKTDLNKMNVQKITEYIERIKQMKASFLCGSFNSDEVKALVDKADFIYMDPPYLIGDAVYNSMWNYQSEYELLDFLDYLLENRKKFVLSNVISKVGKVNEPLSYWCYKNADRIQVVDIDYNYKSASYNKKTRDAKEKEIIVVSKV